MPGSPQLLCRSIEQSGDFAFDIARVRLLSTVVAVAAFSDRLPNGDNEIEQATQLATACTNLGVGLFLTAIVSPVVTGTVGDVPHIAAWLLFGAGD